MVMVGLGVDAMKVNSINGGDDGGATVIGTRIFHPFASHVVLCVIIHG